MSAVGYGITSSYLEVPSVGVEPTRSTNTLGRGELPALFFVGRWRLKHLSIPHLRSSKGYLKLADEIVKKFIESSLHDSILCAEPFSLDEMRAGRQRGRL